MNQDDSSGGEHTARNAPPQRRGGGLRWLLLLLVLGALAYGGWRGWQWAGGALEAVTTQQELLARQARELAALRAQAEELSSRQTDLSAAVRRNGTDIAALGGRLEDGQEALARLNDTVEGGRTRLQLATIEQLLLLANDRLQLAADAAGALKALDLADQRLASLREPQLFRVREALARERASLASMTATDTAGLALSLTEIGRRQPQMPLRASVPNRFESQAAEAGMAPGDAGVVARTWFAVKAAVAGMFALRRTDQPPSRMLAPEEEALVGQILQLKVDGARLALVSGDTRSFRDLTGEAEAWLARYYDESDPGVRAARAELQRLSRLDLGRALPDISQSLALLRAYLGAAAP